MSKRTIMKRGFPDFFPNDCPPNEAQPAAKDFFRFVRTNPPKDNDFRSHVEIQVTRRFRDKCKACGLSVFTELEDIYKLRRRVTAFKSMRVAKGRADPGDGIALRTPTKEENSHHTWWLYEGVAVASKFVIVENGDKDLK